MKASPTWRASACQRLGEGQPGSPGRTRATLAGAGEADQEEVEIERVPINRPVEGPVPIRYEGDTMIVPLLEEVVVVEKRLILKEELHVRKRHTTAPKPQKVVLRSEQVEVERLAPPTDAGPTPGGDKRLDPAA